MTTDTSRELLLAGIERERAALLDLMPRFDDARWREARRSDGWSAHDIATHLADSTYGLALMALGEIQPPGPANAGGWMSVDDLNEQRRQKNAALPREKVQSRMGSAFDHARRAAETIADLDAPGPLGPEFSRGAWVARIIEHAQAHRAELEGLLGS